MEDSILKSTKKLVGLHEEFTAFDLEIVSHINSAFSHLYQLGIGLGAPIEDDEAKWSELGLPDHLLNMVKTFVNLKVKMAFDPPGTSYLIEAAQKQIDEQEWRLNEFVRVDFTP